MPLKKHNNYATLPNPLIPATDLSRVLVNCTERDHIIYEKIPRNKNRGADIELDLKVKSSTTGSYVNLVLFFKKPKTSNH